MALTNKRLCVFCGKAPDTKTREHVVPYWLLEATGDPTRVVPFGLNYAKNKKIIEYAWSAFAAPACESCNSAFSELEGRVKPIVEALMRREAINVGAYVDLLDWLDKVRTGVWLIRHMIEQHPIKITPHFHISSRIGRKDRMVAVYVFDSDNKGINLFGSDSLIFNGMPSCFGFRINNILLLNASADFFCSKGCGLPHPASMKLLMGGENSGKMKLEGISYEVEINHPVTDLKLFKPVVWLYQPIKLPSDNAVFQAGYYGHTNIFDSRIASRTLEGNDRLGALFRQYADHVEVLRNPDVAIEFESVTGEESAMQKDIAASVYDAQVNLFDSVQNEWIEPAQPGEFDEAYRKANLEDAAAHAQMYREAGSAV